MPGTINCEIKAMQEIAIKYKDTDMPLFDRVSEILRNVIVALTINSYEMVALIYQKRCVEGLSKEQENLETNGEDK